MGAILVLNLKSGSCGHLSDDLTSQFVRVTTRKLLSLESLRFSVYVAKERHLALGIYGTPQDH